MNGKLCFGKLDADGNVSEVIEFPGVRNIDEMLHPNYECRHNYELHDIEFEGEVTFDRCAFDRWLIYAVGIHKWYDFVTKEILALSRVYKEHWTYSFGDEVVFLKS